MTGLFDSGILLLLLKGYGALVLLGPVLLRVQSGTRPGSILNSFPWRRFHPTCGSSWRPERKVLRVWASNPSGM